MGASMTPPPVTLLRRIFLKVEVLLVALGFTYFRGTTCTPKPQLLLLIIFISCNMKTNAAMIVYPY